MVSQRYTPPTCTLEVTAKGASLLKQDRFSQSEGKIRQKVRKKRQQEFELHLDDPRLPDDKHITIKGDRADLNELYRAVDNYVRDFLRSSPGELGDRTFDIFPTQKKEAADENTVAIEDLSPTPNPYAVPPSPAHLSKGEAQQIYLRSRDLVNHDLYLGSLATEESGAIVPLSVLQLFDLATALDRCQEDLNAAPYLSTRQEVEGVPEWIKSLVLILITAGLTALGIRLYDRYIIAEKEAANTASIESSNSQGQASPPVSGLPNPNQPPPTLPSPLATLSPLTPLPNATATPTPSGLPGQKPSAIETSVLFPPTSTLPSPPPTISIPAPRPQRSNSSNVVVIPSLPPPVPPQRPVFPAPALPDTSVTLQPRPPRPPTPALRMPPIPSRSYPVAPPSLSRSGVKPFVDVTRIAVSVPRQIDLPALDDSNPAFLASPNPETNPESVAMLEGGAGSDRSSTTNKTATDNKYTLFDRIPQVAEVREYFQKTWEPPKDLDKNLQYSLLLNDDGSIKRVIPIGQASIDFYETANMPFEEEPFVSGMGEGKTARVRVILRKNGKVQTFLEP